MRTAMPYIILRRYHRRQTRFTSTSTVPIRETATHFSFRPPTRAKSYNPWSRFVDKLLPLLVLCNTETVKKVFLEYLDQRAKKHVLNLGGSDYFVYLLSLQLNIRYNLITTPSNMQICFDINSS